MVLRVVEKKKGFYLFISVSLVVLVSCWLVVLVDIICIYMVVSVYG